jgi:hypothetical protein
VANQTRMIFGGQQVNRERAIVPPYGFRIAFRVQSGNIKGLVSGLESCGHSVGCGGILSTAPIPAGSDPEAPNISTDAERMIHFNCPVKDSLRDSHASAHKET